MALLNEFVYEYRGNNTYVIQEKTALAAQTYIFFEYDAQCIHGQHQDHHGVNEVASDSEGKVVNFLFRETIHMNDFHLLHNCGFSGFASAQ